MLTCQFIGDSSRPRYCQRVASVRAKPYLSDPFPTFFGFTVTPYLGSSAVFVFHLIG